jgi:hypothetical protein
LVRGTTLGAVEELVETELAAERATAAPESDYEEGTL